MRKKLIINADDYGRSPGVSRGILQAHREGIVTSLQTNKETLEGILIALHMEKGYLKKGDLEYLLFTRGLFQDRKIAP